MIYNLKVTDYADSKHVEFFKCPIRRTANEEDETITHDIKKAKIIQDLEKDLKEDRDNQVSLQISVNRSKKNLYRIARSNNWQYFLTLTFDRKEDNKFGHKVIDSSNYDEVSSTFSKWVNSIKKYKAPDFMYLAVPEYHADKKHFHFHLLCRDLGDIQLIDSGVCTETGDIMYNIPDWVYGFSTATKIKDNARVTTYIGKYITKELMNKIKYKKRYYASDNCNVCEEKLYHIPEADLYKYYPPEYWSYIKTIHAGNYNQIKYIEIPKDFC